MNPLFFALPGNEDLASRLCSHLVGDLGLLETRRFPDGETYIRLLADVRGRSIVFVCTLDRPDEKTLSLLFAAHAARDLGAARIGLVAPYLGYMRQDKRFRPGEAITSNAYGTLLSSTVDWIVTVDPHLHRAGRAFRLARGHPPSALRVAVPACRNHCAAGYEPLVDRAGSICSCQCVRKDRGSCGSTFECSGWLCSSGGCKLNSGASCVAGTRTSTGLTGKLTCGCSCDGTPSDRGTLYQQGGIAP